MLTADIARAAAAAVCDEVAAGELRLSGRPAHSWYVLPVFGAAVDEPGTYSTPLPLRLAGPAGRPAADVASLIAAHLRRLPWIAAATVAGRGYLRLAVTGGALAALACRITAAGAACAESDALAGHEIAAAAGDWAGAATWAQARALTAAEVTGRCAAAAGARVAWDDPERLARACRADPASGAPPTRAGPAGGAPPLAGPAGGAPPTRVGPAGGAPPTRAGPAGGASRAGTPPRSAGERPADLVAFAGRDAVRFAVCAAASATAIPAAARAAVRHNLSNPGYAVRYAHAHAAATLRQAGGLGMASAHGRGVAGAARLLAHRAQRDLLHVLSWLPERVASAARRADPGVLARYLTDTASAYYAAHESCPALPYAGGPGHEATAHARLRLVMATKTVFATGLRLLGVSPPDVL